LSVNLLQSCQSINKCKAPVPCTGYPALPGMVTRGNINVPDKRRNSWSSQGFLKNHRACTTMNWYRILVRVPACFFFYSKRRREQWHMVQMKATGDSISMMNCQIFRIGFLPSQDQRGFPFLSVIPCEWILYGKTGIILRNVYKDRTYNSNCFPACFLS
jgi:hypothetical protein